MGSRMGPRALCGASFFFLGLLSFYLCLAGLGSTRYRAVGSAASVGLVCLAVGLAGLLISKPLGRPFPWLMLRWTFSGAAAAQLLAVVALAPVAFRSGRSLVDLVVMGLVSAPHCLQAWLLWLPGSLGPPPLDPTPQNR